MSLSGIYYVEKEDRIEDGLLKLLKVIAQS